jgi:hypothetical protein
MMLGQDAGARLFVGRAKQLEGVQQLLQLTVAWQQRLLHCTMEFPVSICFEMRI